MKPFYNKKAAQKRKETYTTNQKIDCSYLQTNVTDLSVINEAFIAKTKLNCLHLITILIPATTKEKKTQKHHLILEIPNVHKTNMPLLIYDAVEFLALENRPDSKITNTIKEFNTELQKKLNHKTGVPVLKFFTKETTEFFLAELAQKTNKTNIFKSTVDCFNEENLEYVSKVFANFLLQFYFEEKNETAKK